MKTKTIKIKFSSWNIYKCILLTALIFSACTQKQNYHIITVKGEGTVVNCSSCNMFVNTKADNLKPAAVVAEEGDLLILGDNLVLYNNSLGDTLEINSDSAFRYLNGKISSLVISNGINLDHWFQGIKEEECKGLQMIAVEDSLSDTNYLGLKKISKFKPNVGISSDAENIKGLLEMFSPSLLVLENFNETGYSVLKKMKDLQLLYVTLDNPIKEPLPFIPKLKSLIVSDISQDRLVSDGFLVNNPQIEQLVLLVKDSINISFIEKVKDLRKLSISGFSNLTGVKKLEKYEDLESLVLIGEKMDEPGIIKNLRKLRWLALPIITNQVELVPITENNPDLEVIEIVKNTSLIDYSPLLKLEKLKALTITDTLTDFNSLKAFKKLKYLSLPIGIEKDSARFDALKKDLPNCTIVTNEGFCLGSGWILLIFPLILGFVIFYRSKRA